MKGKNVKTKELVEAFLDKIEDVSISELIEDLGKPLTAPPKPKVTQQDKGASKQVKGKINPKEEKKVPVAKKKPESDDDEEDGSSEKVELREIFTKKY